MRLLNRRQALAALGGILPAAFVACRHRSQGPAAAGYRMPERKAAIRRGMEFLDKCSAVKENFAEHGADFLWCFYGISACAADRELRREALRLGQSRAKEWRRLHPKLPANADMIDLTAFAYGSYSADLLGERDDEMKEILRRGIAKLRPEEFFGFDPAKEGPPGDIPKRCSKCRRKSARGVKICPKCGNPLKMENRYDLLCEAVITTYSGDRYGIPLGGRLQDVMRWVPPMRPYQVAKRGLNDDFYAIAYMITHLIYGLNDYSLWRLKREWLPDEYAFLRDWLDDVVKGGDFETAGEFIDSLGAFGVTDNDPQIQRALDLILSKQNPDGSWGDPKTSIVYDYYHSTWTAIGGMMEIAWKGEGTVDPEALRQLEEAGRPR